MSKIHIEPLEARPHQLPIAPPWARSLALFVNLMVLSILAFNAGV